ncbi:hypothetical protein Tco_0981172, partial [Tanacetum coccineum]
MDLNKDTYSSALREEEIIYTNAYKEALLDEERFLRQKSKIEWLKEGDQNNAYLYNSIKGRMSKSRIESVYDDSGTYFTDDLFSKKISDNDSLDLVKPVSNDEIKAALFYIEDNKATRPDDFTSIFFKASWGIIGGDVCRAVKEFFSSVSILRRALDEFSLSSCLYPSIAKSTVYFRNAPNNVKCKILMMMPFEEGELPARDEYMGMNSVASKDICMPKSQGGLGLKSLDEWNKDLMSKHLWKILSQRDIIRDFVRTKVGNGRSCNIWFDYWQDRGPLSRFIDQRTIVLTGLSLNTKISHLICNSSWTWPNEWFNDFGEVLNIPVPILNNEIDDRTIWVNRKGKKKSFSMSE